MKKSLLKKKCMLPQRHLIHIEILALAPITSPSSVRLGYAFNTQSLRKRYAEKNTWMRHCMTLISKQ